MLGILKNLRVWDIIDILLVAFIIYRIILLIKGTRAVQMLIGIVVVLGLYGISFRVGLFTLHWILNNFITSLILVIVVIFQDDIRRALTRVGRNPFVGGSSDKLQEVKIVEEGVRACRELVARGGGALMVFEKKTGLNNSSSTTRTETKGTSSLPPSARRPMPSTSWRSRRAGWCRSR